MSIELNPVGVACNLACSYCYEDAMRGAGNINTPWDWDAIKDELTRHGSAFTIFGGEPLLLPIERLELILQFGYEKFKKTGIQTNGTLITDAHIELFRKYNTHVGFSFDGPGECSLSRWVGTKEKTLELAAKTEANIYKLLHQNVSCSVIVTLWKGNCSPDEHFQKLVDWLSNLDYLGMKSARLHWLEVNDPCAAKMRVDHELLNDRMFELMALEQGCKNLRFDVFDEIRRLQESNPNDLTCVWNHCDPYTTHAVQGVEANGQSSNCGRSSKEGINWLKADITSHERQLALYQTPQEDGGCKDCRFFIMCKGHCPGTGIDGDWRNRTEHCPTLMFLFEFYEKSVKNPISLRENLKELEADYIKSLKSAPSTCNSHGDSPHGDSAHGDLHGDSDAQRIFSGVVPCVVSDSR
jgi:uncharacterized protein